MTGHLHSVGESVTYTPDGQLPSITVAECYVVNAQMPSVGRHLQYRIKSTAEAHERVVLEHELTTREPMAGYIGKVSAMALPAADKQRRQRDIHLEQVAARKRVSLAPLRGGV